MNIQTGYLPFAIAIVSFLNVFPLLAQTIERKQDAPTSVAPPKQELPIPAVSVNPTEILALEIGQLRKSLQTLNVRLREIRETLTAPNSQTNTESNIKQNRTLLNFEILSRAEQRAEILRKQLIELTEKENTVKVRLIQTEEDARPENIERSLNTIGSTRAPELRENRRRILETTRTGLQNLQNQIYQNRQRLEEDVRQADLLVETLRKIVFPAIQREIQNTVPGSN